MEHDKINHPAHYTQYKGIEVIQLTEQMNFNKGNAVKYIARAGFKDPLTEVEDLQKAVWYLEREMFRLLGVNIDKGIEKAKVNYASEMETAQVSSMAGDDASIWMVQPSWNCPCGSSYGNHITENYHGVCPSSGRKFQIVQD